MESEKDGGLRGEPKFSSGSEGSKPLWVEESGRLSGGGSINRILKKWRTCHWQKRESRSEGPAQVFGYQNLATWVEPRWRSGEESQGWIWSWGWFPLLDGRALALTGDGGWGPEGKASIPTGARTEELGAPCSRLLHSLVLRSTPYFLLQFGRTEVIDNTLNPDFVRKFIVDYFFEEKQNLRFDL